MANVYDKASGLNTVAWRGQPAQRVWLGTGNFCQTTPPALSLLWQQPPALAVVQAWPPAWPANLLPPVLHRRLLHHPTHLSSSRKTLPPTPPHPTPSQVFDYLEMNDRIEILNSRLQVRPAGKDTPWVGTAGVTSW